MTDRAAHAAPPPGNEPTGKPRRTRTPGAPQSSLRTRIRVYAAVGFLVVGGWLYYTINAVVGLYDTTVQIARFTELRALVSDALGSLQEGTDSLDRYVREGEGYDLSQHYTSRTALRTSLGAIRRQVLAESTRGKVQRAEAAEEAYAAAAEAAIHARSGKQPGEPFAIRDNQAFPAAAALREVLSDLELDFARGQAFGELQLKSFRNAATTALAILGGIILVALFGLLFDIDRRILSPCVAASRALADLVAGRPPPHLPDAPNDEVGALGFHFNSTAFLYAERGRALEARDIEASVNAVLAAAASVNDLQGFGSRVLDKVIDVTGASSAVLYLPEPNGDLAPAVSIGGAEGPAAAGRDEARRALQEQKPIHVTVDARTPTVDLFDGRILPRESLHVPLVHFGQAIGVLALGAVRPFTDRQRNTLTSIAPSLAVTLANASANEQLSAQSHRLAEQNELLEEQRSRIARTARELQRASALKDRFLATVSHELRTPMTVILGFTGALLRGAQGELKDRQRESLERVQRSARHLLGLINDVLDISRIEAGRTEVQREVVSIRTLTAQVESEFKDAAGNKGIALATHIAPGLDNVISDGAKLRQILTNLVSNALKFTERGSIDVRAEPRGEKRWALVVTDSGIGIPAAEQETVFEEFRQGEAEGHRGHGGTGLGLAIVRKLALVLGGTVALQSAPGEGSTFTVTLPRELPSEPAAAIRALPAAAAARTGRVLVIDDDESTRKLLRFELEPFGLTVLEAADGREGLAIAARQKPDAVVLDVVMPRMDGWGTLRALKDSPATRSIPVLVHSVVNNRAFGFSFGAFDHLVKPVSRETMVAALRRAGVLDGGAGVLVADDDRDIRELLARDLAAAGYRVRTARDGAETLEELATERPSAVILDLLMPEPDGFEILYRMRDDAALRDLPVIVLTGKNLTRADYARLNGSARRIIHKGADMTRLVRDVLATVTAPAPPAASARAG
jgi:signal transduction histidine kinase/DNA-binding response OmpR family regulator